MPSINHVHTYVRVRGTKARKSQKYMCADPHCAHVTLKEYLFGKASRCPECHNEFILSSQDLKRARPLCLNCRNTKEARLFRQQKDKVASILSEFITEETEEQIAKS